MLCPGPMVRRVRDVMPLLSIMAGPDLSDPVCRTMALGDPASVDYRDMVVHTALTNGRFRPTDVMMQAVEDTARALER